MSITTLDARVTIIDHGRVIATGTPADLVRAHADTAIEMTFDGAPPELQLGAGIIVERDDQRLRILTTDPAAATRIALESLADHTGRPRSLEIAEPSFDAVFLALTGHRISHEVDGDA